MRDGSQSDPIMGLAAHRKSGCAGRVVFLVMKDGDIIEQGNHEELLAKKGFYADLYNIILSVLIRVRREQKRCFLIRTACCFREKISRISR